MNRPNAARFSHLSGMVLLASLGLFHISITPFMFNELSGRLVWYLATDFAVLLLLFLNVAVLYMTTPARVPWRLCHIANILGVALGVFNLVAVPVSVNIVVLMAYVLTAVGAYLRDQQQQTSEA
jgi:hypothetical protein